MKLGRDTGSFHNHLFSRQTKGQPTPVVGMGATVLCWTDRRAATIVSVEGKQDAWLIGLTYDEAKRIDTNGMSECQSYEFASTVGPVAEWFRFKGGRWRQCYVDENTHKLRLCKGGSGLMIGIRDHYHDFSF